MHAIPDNRKSGPGFISKYLKLLFDVRSHFHLKVRTFLIFVVISAGFWFVRALGEQYEDTVSYPVRYVNLPENKVLVGELPEKLGLKVQARGFSLLKSKMNLNLTPLRFDMNALSLNSFGTDTLVIITETIKDLLSEELDQMKILDISPDTLFFCFSRLETRKVPVIPALKMHDRLFRKQFTQNGDIRVVPDSIFISGPGNVVAATPAVHTKRLSFTDLTSDITVTCDLDPVKTLTFSSAKVQVTIPVDRFTEVEENLQVVPVNVPDSLAMVPIPGKVKATYRICLSNYQKIQNMPLSPRVDYQEISEKPNHRLTVFLTDTPGIVNNLRFTPGEVEFLITRK